MTVTHSRTQTIPALPEPHAPLTQDAFSEALADYFGNLSGLVGVAVHDFATGTDFTYNADEIYPTASTLKVPLLYTLYRLADAGELDLSQRVTLSHKNRVPGSGVLQHMDDGLQPTLRDLAELDHHRLRQLGHRSALEPDDQKDAKTAATISAGVASAPSP